MGRRNRSKANGWDEHDDCDEAEMKWLMNRQASSHKRQKTSEDSEPPAKKSEDSIGAKKESPAPVPQEQEQKKPTDDLATQNENSPKNGISSDKDKIKRLKLKQQRKKDRRKEKKLQAASNKLQKTSEDAEPSATKSEDSKGTNKKSPALPEQEKSIDDLATQNKDGPTNGNSSEQDKIERMKLKRQRQKERQKEKKAQAASAAEAARRSRRESEKALQNQQKQEQEKKKKLKKKQSQQAVTLNKGVKCEDLVVGTGLPVQDRKKVHVSYTLRSKSHTSGKILDSSGNFGFRVGKGEVIKGWDIGLENMKVGGVRRLVVPPQAGYGYNKDVGAGKGADLYFQIELLHVAH